MTLFVTGLLLLGVAAVAGPTAPLAHSPQAGSLRPVDEAARDPSLRALRRDLLAAAASRDAARLRPFLAVTVTMDQTRDLTADEVVRWIRSQSPADQTAFWQDLRTAVNLGFLEFGDGMCAPSIVFLLPDDADGGVAVAARGVRVRREPRADAPIIDTLTFALVEPGPESSRRAAPGFEGGDYEWQQVRLADQRLGWVLSKYLIGPGSRRFCFERIGGQWKLVAFGVAD